MKLIESSLKNPVAVGMVVLLVAVFGFLSLRELPLQLFPDIDRPQIGDSDELARGLARRSRIRIARTAGTGAAGPAGHGGTRRQCRPRRQLHQSDVRDRHRHEERAGRGDRPAQSRAFDSEGCRPPGRATRRRQRRRQRERIAVVVLRAVAARHAGPDRQLSPLHREHGQAAHRGGARRVAGRSSMPGRRTKCASPSTWPRPRASA